MCNLAGDGNKTLQDTPRGDGLSKVDLIPHGKLARVNCRMVIE